jgi:hypothetical protein
MSQFYQDHEADMYDPEYREAFRLATIEVAQDELAAAREKIAELEADLVQNDQENEILRAINTELEAQLAAAMNLHYDSYGHCRICVDPQHAEYEPWPCPTTQLGEGRKR